MIRTISGATALACLAQAGDPSPQWLSYVEYRASDKITSVRAAFVVPSQPLDHGEPSFWFGLQNAKGDGALIQPVLWYVWDSQYHLFHEVYDWTDEHDERSDDWISNHVQPGDRITASLEYRAESDSYDMVATNTATGHSTTYNYKLMSKQKEPETVLYFVLEHQPASCSGLPPNGSIKFEDIEVEVQGELVQPSWTAKQGLPACSSKGVALDSKTVQITWDSSSDLIV